MVHVATGMERLDDDRMDLVLYLVDEDWQQEFSLEFLTERVRRNLTKEQLKSLRIRAVKIVLAGALILTIPLSQALARGPRYAMSYVYFGSMADQMEVITLAQDTLAVVSPSYFDIQPDGSLKINPISGSFVKTMHGKGLRVVPFLSNHWDRGAGIQALENREKLAQQIADAVEQYDLDGVNVDIENVTQSQRDQYTDFVRRLRSKLPKEKEVSVAVAANPWGWTTGWQGSYDYAALGKIADHLFIMSYDEHYQGGEAGPVASIGFVEDSVKYALQHVPASKIVLGIPFFGRIWSADGSVKGMGVSNKQAEQIVKDYRANVTYDPTARSPKATFSLGKNDKLVINGKAMKPGIYTLWYENADSIKEKLSLVDKYNLKGAGNWSAGQESRDVWEYYDLWLNGKYFEDIYHHFAKDDIIRVVKNGYMKGISNSRFGPAKSLTRAEAATVAVRVLELDTQNGNTTFRDVKGHWAERNIAAAARAGIIRGYSDNSFRPDQHVTREEIASILSRMIRMEYYEPDGAVFSDVEEDRWSYHEITSLASAGILNGYGDGTFRPEQALTRGELAVLLERAVKDKLE